MGASWASSPAATAEAFFRFAAKSSFPLGEHLEYSDELVYRPDPTRTLDRHSLEISLNPLALPLDLQPYLHVCQRFEGAAKSERLRS